MRVYKIGGKSYMVHVYTKWVILTKYKYIALRVIGRINLVNLIYENSDLLKRLFSKYD